MPAHRPMETRFWSKVNKDGPVPTGHPEYDGLGPCWIYNRGRSHLLAYPCAHKRVASGEPRQVTAWRFCWELHNGAIPEGLVVRHRCDNGGAPVRCVNPAHLVLGTQGENVEDMWRRRQSPNHSITSDMAEAIIELRDHYKAPIELLRRAVGTNDAGIASVLYDGRAGVAPAERKKAAEMAPEEIERAVALVGMGRSVGGTAGEIGRSWGAVRTALVTRGIEPTPSPALTAEELATVRAVLAEGRSIGAAAHTIGRSWNHVRKALHDLGLEGEIPAKPTRDQRISDEKRTANRQAALASRWAKYRERKAAEAALLGGIAGS
jgi:hypothetical protein